MPAPVGTATYAATTTAGAISGSLAATNVGVQADPLNTDHIFVGTSTAQVIRLRPGDSATIPVSNVNQIYAKSQSGSQNLNWIAVA